MLHTKPTRRSAVSALCVGAAGILSSRLRAEPKKPGSPKGLLQQYDLRLDGSADIAKRALVLCRGVPKPHTPALIMLHGLGETGNELRGIHAWGKDYGLIDAHRRLHQLPLERTNPRQRLVEQSWLDRVNAELEARPMGDMVYVCPVTPNPRGQARVLDDYAAWLETVLIPALRSKVPKLGKLGIAGCSLGGYVATEVYFRKPELFHSLGIVQGAIGHALATTYGKRLAVLAARGQATPIHLLSSEQDPYLKATRRLSRVLEETQYPHLLEVLPGPHTQPWLREAGTVATLYWQDRALRSPRLDSDRQASV